MSETEDPRPSLVELPDNMYLVRETVQIKLNVTLHDIMSGQNLVAKLNSVLDAYECRYRIEHSASIDAVRDNEPW